MGRRPNAVISEWFARGAKLEDSSNRYAHTCRRCGELFAKGRVEYLMQHLLKRCRNVTEADRNAILLQLQHTPAPKSSNRSSQKAKSALNHYAGVDVNLPVALDRQQSALDTLAEVSRHHLDYSVQRQVPLEPAQFNESDQDLAEQALWAQLQQHTMDLPTHADANTYDMTGHGQPHEPSYNAESFVQGVNDPQQEFINTQNAYHTGFNHLDPQLDHGTAVHLVSTMPADAIPVVSSSNNVPNQFRENTQERTNPMDSKHVFIKYAPEVPYTNKSDDGLLDHHRMRSRGRFTETRRREVQEIRKRGACIRCRMLKKPCSEGTPCKTCANVDVARLWKGKCLRTKLSDEFSGWSTQFFSTLCALRVQASMPKEMVIPLLSLRVQLGSTSTYENNNGDDDGSIVFNVSLRRSQAPSRATNESLPSMNPYLVVILEPKDSDAEHLANLCTKGPTLDKAVKQEPNRLVGCTIQEACALCGLGPPNQELLNAVPSLHDAGASDVRASSNFPNLLLRNTLQLWVISTILTKMQLANDQSNSLLAFDLQDRQSIGVSDEMLTALTTSNHDLIRLQLFQMLEMKAAKLSRVVMVDLERHLLQRQQVSGYATFIAAVVLLDCVERMTAFYSTFDAAAHSQSITSPTTFSAADWPLPILPSAIWSQGPSFAQLLQMLLRMRGLPPRTYEDERGMLAVVNESTGNIAKLNGNVSEAQLRAHEEERQQALTQWLRKCDVTADEVRAWLHQSNGWRGRFVAGLLLDES